MRPTELLTSTLLFAAASTAWSPFPALERNIEARQDATTTSFNLDYTGVQGNTATTSTTSAESASGSDSASGSNTATGSDTTTGSDSTASITSSQANSSQTTDQSSEATTKTYDARLPAGGVSMITPAAIATQYYKIKDQVTFAWNYTSLSATPSAVDVLASCSVNNEIYTIASNMTITGPSQSVTWDTGAYQSTATVPLLTETYTLIIHDAAKDISAVPMAGYLGTYDSFTFGMYVPQVYTPLAEYHCATCSSALSLTEQQTMGFMCGMAVLTVLSFGWFSGMAGIW